MDTCYRVRRRGGYQSLNSCHFGPDSESDSGLPEVVNIRSGGGWDVTLTLPDGRRATFALRSGWRFSSAKPTPNGCHPPMSKPRSHPSEISLIPFYPPYWQEGGDKSPAQGSVRAGARKAISYHFISAPAPTVPARRQRSNSERVFQTRATFRWETAQSAPDRRQNRQTLPIDSTASALSS